MLGAIDVNHDQDRVSVESRCAEIVRHHQALSKEIREASVKVCECQRAWWREQALARRVGRKADQSYLEILMTAQSELHACRYEKSLFEDPGDGFNVPKKTAKPGVVNTGSPGIRLDNKIASLVREADENPSEDFCRHSTGG